LAGPRGSAGSPEDTEGPAPELSGLPEIIPLPKPKPTEPPNRPFRLVGNRDWVIPIECVSDGVVLRSVGQKFTLASLKPVQGAETALVQAVRQVIARRQATVRPGDPPYRPQLRFLIHPEGLRTYHLAYPTLEGLKIPMTRENADKSSQ
jgi:hypothetical protein